MFILHFKHRQYFTFIFNDFAKRTHVLSRLYLTFIGI